MKRQRLMNSIGSCFSFLRIRREERWPVIVTTLILLFLTGLVIYHYYPLFSMPMRGTWGVFPRNYHVSGFDALIYTMVSRWNTFYTIVMRHPLLAFLLYPLSVVNDGLFALTGVNCVQFVVAVPLLFCSVYSFVFIFRIFRHVMGLQVGDAWLLSAFGFSFAFILLSAIVPDHFAFSLFFITLTLYIAGRQMGRSDGKGHISLLVEYLLFFFTAGLTLTNGVKTWLAVLFTNGRRFFTIRHLLLGVVLPAVFMMQFSQWEYRTFTVPGEIARAKAKAKIEAKKAKDGVPPKKTPGKSKKDGKPISDKGFLQWSDISTSRSKTVVENLFGESIQLHQKHLLKDVHMGRPVFVAYDHWWNYAVEGLVVLLFVAGIWYGRRQRFLWLLMSIFLADMVLHLGFGFGINEVYIMATHWIYVIPLAMGYLFKSCLDKRSGLRYALRGLVLFLTSYLYIYNIWLITKYLIM